MKKINLVFILATACALLVCASGVVSVFFLTVDDYVKGNFKRGSLNDK